MKCKAYVRRDVVASVRPDKLHVLHELNGITLYRNNDYTDYINRNMTRTETRYRLGKGGKCYSDA
jgi:hypothetical protein